MRAQRAVPGMARVRVDHPTRPDTELQSDPSSIPNHPCVSGEVHTAGLGRCFMAQFGNDARSALKLARKLAFNGEAVAMVKSQRCAVGHYNIQHDRSSEAPKDFTDQCRCYTFAPERGVNEQPSDKCSANSSEAYDTKAFFRDDNLRFTEERHLHLIGLKWGDCTRSDNTVHFVWLREIVDISHRHPIFISVGTKVHVRWRPNE